MRVSVRHEFDEPALAHLGYLPFRKKLECASLASGVRAAYFARYEKHRCLYSKLFEDRKRVCVNVFVAVIERDAHRVGQFPACHTLTDLRRKNRRQIGVMDVAHLSLEFFRRNREKSPGIRDGMV